MERKVGEVSDGDLELRQERGWEVGGRDDKERMSGEEGNGGEGGYKMVGEDGGRESWGCGCRSWEEMQ